MSQTKVDLSSLPPQQLAEIQKQFEQDIEQFTISLQSLGTANQKFLDCIQNIKRTSETQNEGKKLLVPLTSSLYVPGKIINNQKYMVDVGTGYYVEKGKEDAIKFYQQRVDKLKTDSTELEKIIASKVNNLRAIEDVLRQKIAESEKGKKK